MAWPLSQDYNEAIQSPKSNFADRDLRRGDAVCNALGIPMPYSGNFADVYQVRCPDGKSWAVKCFTRQAEGLRERYAAISAHLSQTKLPFIVDFTYLEQGIRVAGTWYPVLKMQWVEGLTLNQFVGKSLDKPAMLEGLFQVWGRMGKGLRDAEAAHCDLQHGNVLLVPGGSANSLALKLIDYDGMWVPSLAGTKSGEVGHPCYQHPQRLRDGTYTIEVDRFSLLLVATSLRALKLNGKRLWDKYDNGDNMLFKEPDLREPTKSPLFLELIRSSDPRTAALADHLFNALRGGLESAPLLDEATSDRRPAPATTRSRPIPAPAPTTQMAIPLASPAAAAPTGAGVLDFGEAAPDVSRPARKRGKAKRGLPIAAWIGAAALLVLGVAAVGVAAWELSGNADTAKPTPANGSLAQNTNVTTSQPGTIAPEIAPPPARPALPRVFPDPGYTLLFDGTPTADWSPDVGDAQQWKVEDGAMVGRSSNSQPTTHLLYSVDYADFTLRLEYMVDPGSRGGVDIRARVGEQILVDGSIHTQHPLFQLSDPTKYTDWPSGTTRWVKDDKPFCNPGEPYEARADLWHQLEITVQRHACVGFLDNKKVVDIHLDPDSGDATVPALKRAKGRIGLQANTGTIRFRKIEIKELPPANTAAAPAAPADRFPVLPGGTGKVRVEGDALILDDLDHAPACANIYFGDTQWTDYDFQADVKRLAGSSHCALWFRHFDLGNQWCYSFGKGSRLVTLENLLLAAWRPGIQRDVGPIGNDDWYTLRVSVRGSDFRCFVDGRPTFMESRQDHPRGCVGFHANGSRFAFRNIKVTAPDGQLLLAGLPDLSPPAASAGPSSTDKRTSWVHNRGSFANVKDKDWREMIDADTHELAEVNRNEDYVELQGKADTVTFRLHRYYCEVRSGDGPFKEFYRGAWEELPAPPPVAPKLVLTKENFDKIAKGMKEEDVVKLLGPPTSRRPASMDGAKVTDDRWQEGDAIIDVTIGDGKVIAKGSDQNWQIVYPSDSTQAGPATAEEDTVRAKLDKAKADFDKAVEQFHQNVHDGLDKAEEAARFGNDKDRLDKIPAERKAFDDNGDLPKSVPLAKDFKQHLDEARKTLDDAYAAAVKGYTTEKKDAKATAVAEERKQFQARHPTDAFKIGSVWKGKAVQVWTGDKPPAPATSDFSLTVLERDDKTFKARIENRNCTQEVQGAIQKGVILWFAKDAKALVGQLPPAADFVGKFSGDALELRSEWRAFNNAPTVLTVGLQLEKK